MSVFLSLLSIQRIPEYHEIVNYEDEAVYRLKESDMSSIFDANQRERKNYLPMKKNILVVDDEKDILRIVAYSLQKWGYEVITATNGQDGLDKIAAEKPDLILLDASMPVMSGLEMLTQMRDNPDWRDIPVIMLTAHSDPKTITSAAAFGIVEYVTKPFDPMELREKIDKALTHSHS